MEQMQMCIHMGFTFEYVLCQNNDRPCMGFQEKEERRERKEMKRKY